jgi:solute:Na+ symporter, SSS family
MQGFLGQQGIGFWLMMACNAALLGAVSIYLARYVKSTGDFFSGSGFTPWWVSGLSFFMTAFSASVFVANASFTYRHGMLSFMMVVFFAPVFLLGYLVFSRKWRRTGVSTAIEFIDTRYSGGASKFFIWTGIPIRILDNANRLYVTAVLIEVLLGVNIWTGIVITSVITLIYTIFGGFLAVVVTDSIQAIMMAVIVTVIAVVGCIRIGGVSELISQLPERFWNVTPEGTDYSLAFVAAMTVVGLFAWNGYWSLVQRFVSVPTEKDAQKVALTSAISYFVLFPLFFLPPLYATILIPGLEGPETEQCYMRVAQMLLPSALLGLLCFSIFGATVTALNSELNVIAQIAIQDVFKNILKSLNDKKRLFISRAIIVIVMLLCMIVAGFIRKLGGSFHYLITLMSLTTLPTFMPLLIGLLYKKTPAWGAVLSFCTGLGTGIILTFVYKVPTASMVFANFSVTMITLIVTGELWPVKGERAIVVEKLFSRLSIKGSSDIKVDGSEVTVNSRLIMVTVYSFLLLSGLLVLLSLVGEFSILTLTVAAIFLAIGLLLAAIKSLLEKSAMVKVKG